MGALNHFPWLKNNYEYVTKQSINNVTMFSCFKVDKHHYIHKKLVEQSTIYLQIFYLCNKNKITTLHPYNYEIAILICIMKDILFVNL